MFSEDKGNLVIGIVGGMGPYATVDLFRRLVDAFPTEKDWEKPHIIVDSYSEIPSRVRAVLYSERRDEVVDCLVASIRHLMEMGVQKIIVGCHTAHIFLPEAVKRVAGSDDCVVNIIKAAVAHCVIRKYKKLRLLASEGTVLTKIYNKAFSNTDIEIINPTEDELVNIRTLIEDVKQNKISVNSMMLFKQLVEKDHFPVILGCSELPALLHNCTLNGIDFSIEMIDPFQCAIDFIKDDWSLGRDT